MISEDQLQRIEQSLLHYAHEMHEYTLQLWTDSRRVAEEKKAGRGTKPAKQRRAPELVHAKSRIVDHTHVVRPADAASKAAVAVPVLTAAQATASVSSDPD